MPTVGPIVKRLAIRIAGLAASLKDRGDAKIAGDVTGNHGRTHDKGLEQDHLTEKSRPRAGHLQLHGNHIGDILSPRGCDMDELIKFELKPGAPTVTRDSRRPGRREFVDPALIPLLREQGPPIADSPAEPADLAEPVDLSEFHIEPSRRATLAPARGILLGVALGTLTWACVGVGLWFYFQG
jgi:hypothetical protein